MPNNINIRDIVSIAVTVLLIILGIIGGLAGQGKLLPDKPDSQGVSQNQPKAQGLPTQQQILDATNAYRAQNGRSPVKADPQLNQVAQKWAEQMAREEHLYHNPNYGKQYRPGWRAASENVAQNWVGASAEAIVDQWAKSPGHNKNMLSPGVTHLGVGVAKSASGKVYAVQNFAQY